jgi:hypothetical protein
MRIWPQKLTRARRMIGAAAENGTIQHSGTLISAYSIAGANTSAMLMLKRWMSNRKLSAA